MDSREHPVVGMGQPVKPADPKRGSYSRYEAWHDLLMEACWRERKVDNKGRMIMLARGELMAARKWLADRWNWTEMAVRWFLERLESTQQILRKDNHSDDRLHKRSVGIISVCNYDKYQTRRDLELLLGNPLNNHSTTTQQPHPYKDTILEGTNVPLSSGQPELVLSDGVEPKMTASKAAREAFSLYNETAKRCGLPEARSLSMSRAKSLAMRVKEAGGLDAFKQAMANLEKSAFLQGRNDNGWRANLDFVCQPSSFHKLLEGTYGNGAHSSAPKTGFFRKRDVNDMTLAEYEAHLEKGYV